MPSWASVLANSRATFSFPARMSSLAIGIVTWRPKGVFRMMKVKTTKQTTATQAISGTFRNVWMAINRSDGGRSWLRQTSGVLADLVTGSALSEKVCWIVGRVGAILLTTDGGEHWKTVTSPISEDLGGIRATDALDATVWNAKNTKTFETSDGG